MVSPRVEAARPTALASDSSQYSPVLRLQADFVGRIVVTVDSGTLTVPGEQIQGAPVLMSQLYLTTIVAALDSSTLAVTRTGASRHSIALPRGGGPWQSAIQSS